METVKVTSEKIKLDFKDSKYTTYTGDYWIKMNDKLVKTVDEVLEYLKAEIINTIKNQ